MTDLRQASICVRAITLGLATSAILFIGCAAPKAPPSIAAENWTGPGVTLVSSDTTHRVAIEAPSPGWQPTLDQTRQSWRAQEVYITLREPSPLYFYPQVVTKHDVGTNVPSSTPLRVYVRNLPADAKPEDETPYRLAVRSGQ